MLPISTGHDVPAQHVAPGCSPAQPTANTSTAPATMWLNSPSADQPGHHDDHQEVRRLGERQQPDEQRDQPAGEDAARRAASPNPCRMRLAAELDELAPDGAGRTPPVRATSARTAARPAGSPPARRPTAGARCRSVRRVLPLQQRQHRRQRVLGEQLLAAEDDDQEPDAVPELATSGRHARVRQVVRGAGPRRPSRSPSTARPPARPEQRRRRPLQLLVGLLEDGLVDDLAAGRLPVFGLGLLGRGRASALFGMSFIARSCRVPPSGEPA